MNGHVAPAPSSILDLLLAATAATYVKLPVVILLPRSRFWRRLARRRRVRRLGNFQRSRRGRLQRKLKLWRLRRKSRRRQLQCLSPKSRLSRTYLHCRPLPLRLEIPSIPSDLVAMGQSAASSLTSATSIAQRRRFGAPASIASLTLSRRLLKFLPRSSAASLDTEAPTFRRSTATPSATSGSTKRVWRPTRCAW